MNVFAIFEAHLREVPWPISSARAFSRRCRICRGWWSSRRAIPVMATSPPMQRWSWPRRRPEAARSGRCSCRAACALSRMSHRSSVAGPGIHQPDDRPHVLAAKFWQRRSCAGGHLWPQCHGRGRPGQCRVRLRQSDRADACRPLPRRRGRRRARRPARLRRLRRRPASTTSTTPARRSTSSPARPSCATARPLARRSAIPEGLYPGDYLVPVGAGAGREAWPRAPRSCRRRSLAADRPRRRHRGDDGADPRRPGPAQRASRRVLLRALPAGAGRSVVAATIAELRAKGDVYEGRLPPPKGQKDDDWEDREQTLFRSTPFGDDVDRPLLKSDGSYTYFASDIAYHKNKFDRGFPSMIDVWGADHGGYVKRMQAAVKAVDRRGRARST